MSGTGPEAWVRPSSQPSRIKTGADFVKNHKPPEWLIDGIVQQGRLYACTSLTGHGKTAVWLFNACMIQAGRMVGNLDVSKGNVLILAGENPEDLAARMLGMARDYNLRAADLPYVLPGAFGMDEDAIDRLKLEIGSLGVDLCLIIGDTAASFFPGEDENNNVEAGDYARRLRTLTECPGNPAVIVLCHPTKNAATDNLLPRGGGAFLNELDCNLTLWSTVPGEITALHWHGKIRGPDFASLSYKVRTVPTGLRDDKGRDEITVVVEPLDETSAANQTKQRLTNEDAVLRQLQAEPGKSMTRIAIDAGWVDDAGQPQKWIAQRCIDALRQDKLISQPRRGAGWKLTQAGDAYLAAQP
jgi:hypothetical protein